MANNSYDYLGNLTLDKKSGLYDLFITTYSGRSVQLRAFFLEKKHEMRMDLVSNDIYQTTDYVGTLCQLNSILNPFSVNTGDILFFCSRNDADSLMLVSSEIKFARIEELVNASRSTLIDLTKKSKVDPNRVNYIGKRNEQSQSPTMLPQRQQQISANNSTITIGGNITTGNVGNGIFLGQPNDYQNAGNDMLTLNDILANNYKNSKIVSTDSPVKTTVIIPDTISILQEVLSTDAPKYGSYDTPDTNKNTDVYDRVLIKKYIRRID